MCNEFEKAPLGRLMAKFCIPCIASLIISCLYNIVDQIFVGNGVGYLGNAATGVIFPITVVGWALSLLFGDGGAASLSIAQGEGQNHKVMPIVGQSILMALLSGIVLSALAYWGGAGLLLMIGATDATLDMALSYGWIIFAMMPLAMVQNAMAALIRAKGAPGWAMLSMIVGAIINIIGDPLAIFVWHMGIQGAAWATIIGQFISLLFCAAFFLQKNDNRLHLHDFAIQGTQVLRIMRMGSSSLLTQLAIVIITVVNNVLLVKYGALSVYGADVPLAAFVVIMKLFQIVLNVAIGIAAGSQPIAGYNYGAGNGKRLQQLFARMIAWTFGFCIVCTLCFFLFPNQLIGLFGSDGELYMQFASKCMMIYLSCISLTCVQKVCAIFLQSIGFSARSAFLAILRDALLIIFSFITPVYWGVEGIFWAAPLADVCAIVITAGVMVPALGQIRRLKKEEPESALQMA